MWPQLWNLPSSAVDSLCNLRLDLRLLTSNMGPAPRYPHCHEHRLSSFRGHKTLYHQPWQTLSLTLDMFRLPWLQIYQPPSSFPHKSSSGP